MPFGKGGPAGSFRRKAKALNRKKNKRVKMVRSKSGLNKLEKKQVKNIISDRKESKYCPDWYSYDDYAVYGSYLQPRIAATAVMAGIFNGTDSACTCVGLQTGNYLNSASTAQNAAVANTMWPLGGFGMERGDDNRTIDGDYAYMQSSHIKLQISASIFEGTSEANNVTVNPLEFRVIQVRAKIDAAGVTPSLSSGLLLDLTNDSEGLGMVGSVNEIMHQFPVNQNRFHKVKDFKFKLSQPIKPTNLAAAAGANQYFIAQTQTTPQTPYPTSKHLTLWLNKPAKKLRFSPTDNGSTNYFEPVNYDYVDYVLIICNRATYYNAYSAGGAGQTPVQSTVRSWTVSATGQTKYRDC